MSPRRPSPIKAFFQWCAGYVTGLAGKARRAFVTIVTALPFFVLFGCSPENNRPEYTASMAYSVVKLVLGPESSGSGVIVGLRQIKENRACKISVATARHVVTYALTENKDDGSTVVSYVLRDSVLLDSVKAEVIAFHPKQDIAVAIFSIAEKCSDLSYVAAHIEASTPLPLDQLVHVGYPAGWRTVAIASFVGPSPLEEEDLYSVTSSAGPGSSGGAMFYNDRLIGILVRGEMAPPWRNLYVPIKYLHDLVPDIA